MYDFVLCYYSGFGWKMQELLLRSFLYFSQIILYKDLDKVLPVRYTVLKIKGDAEGAARQSFSMSPDEKDDRV